MQNGSMIAAAFVAGYPIAVSAVQARYVHFVDTPSDLSDADRARLDGLLTYGEPAQADVNDGAIESFVVIPRFGTISPWASKATDIVHNCGMTHIHRVERGVAYRVVLKGGILGTSLGAAKGLNAEQAQAVGHDDAGGQHHSIPSSWIQSDLDDSFA